MQQLTSFLNYNPLLDHDLIICCEWTLSTSAAGDESTRYYPFGSLRSGGSLKTSYRFTGQREQANAIIELLGGGSQVYIPNADLFWLVK